MKEYVKNNPEKYAAYNHKRRAAALEAGGEFSQDDIFKMLEKQGNKCAYCHASVSEGYHVDHIVALANGGSNWPENLQILCPPCNLSKGAKCHIEWAQSLGRLL